MSVNLESGETSLYPKMHDIDISQNRISFIPKVYSILTFQLLLTIIVVSIVAFVSPIANFFNNNIQDHAFDIVSFIAFCLLCYYHEKHPLCYIFLLILTISMALSVGSTCALVVGSALAGGKLIILEVFALTTVVVISLSLYTFWATKRGHDFNFLGSFLIGAVLALIFIGFIQNLFFPIEKLSAMIYGCLISSIIIYGCIVYYTNNLIKWCSYADFIWVSTMLYIYVISVFLSLLSIFCIAKLLKKNKI